MFTLYSKDVCEINSTAFIKGSLFPTSLRLHKNSAKCDWTESLGIPSYLLLIFLSSFHSRSICCVFAPVMGSTNFFYD